MPITHKFVSGKADDADATLVRPSNWNDTHAVTDILLPEVSTPAAPASDNAIIYAVDDDGQTRVEYRTADGNTVRLARDRLLTVQNVTGSTLTKGQWVYISGANANKTRVALARADSLNTAPAVGVVIANIANGADGLVMIGGVITGVDTSAFTAGDRLFLSQSTAGAITATQPTQEFRQRVGFCLNSHASNGSILVETTGLAPRQDDDGNLLLNDSGILPPVPAAGTGVVMFARNVGGRRMPAFMGPSGLDSALQPFLARNKVGYWTPVGNATTAPLAFGIAAPTATGTATARNVATTNLLTSMKRLGYVSAGTAGQATGPRLNVTQFWRGNAAGLGGFHLVMRFGFSDASVVATARGFCGFTSGTAAPTDVNPSTLTNIIGVGYDQSETSLSIMHNDGTGTATKVSLGANFPANTNNTDVYDVAFFARPNGSEVGWRVERLNTGDVASGTITTKMPAATQLLALTMWRANGGTASAVAIDLVSLYIETDQ